MAAARAPYSSGPPIVQLACLLLYARVCYACVCVVFSVARRLYQELYHLHNLEERQFKNCKVSIVDTPNNVLEASGEGACEG